MKISLTLGILALVVAEPAMAETWATFSRTPNNAFLIDVDTIAVDGEIARVSVATVFRRGESGDYSHSVERYEFKCGARQWRTAGLVDYGEDGAEAGQTPEEDGSWEAVRPRTLPDFLKEMVCDGARPDPPTWPSIKAFVDGGRTLPEL